MLKDQDPQPEQQDVASQDVHEILRRRLASHVNATFGPPDQSSPNAVTPEADGSDKTPPDQSNAA